MSTDVTPQDKEQPEACSIDNPDDCEMCGS